MNELSKIVLLAYIGEKIITNMDTKKEAYPKIRDALDFCWKWIEREQVDEESIYEFLDDEDEDDLIGYMLYASNEREKKEYGVILGVVSYISHNILINNNSPVPQFLSQTDDNYYDLIIADVIQLNIMDCTNEKIINVTNYCEKKIMENDLVFIKSEVMSLK